MANENIIFYSILFNSAGVRGRKPYILLIIIIKLATHVYAHRGHTVYIVQNSLDA